MPITLPITGGTHAATPGEISSAQFLAGRSDQIWALLTAGNQPVEDLR